MDGLSHLVGRESQYDNREVKLADETVGNCIAVEYGLAFQCPCLKGVTERVTEVECFADILLVWVFLYDFLRFTSMLSDSIRDSFFRSGWSKSKANRSAHSLSLAMSPCLSISA